MVRGPKKNLVSCILCEREYAPWHSLQKVCKDCRKAYKKETKRLWGIKRRSDPVKYKEMREKLRIWKSKDKPRELAYRKKNRIKNRSIVYAHYGDSCTCCGENKFEFLSIDHINGGGSKHRKELGGYVPHTWIIKNNFPDNLRLLCMNCNCSLGRYGYCPHDSK